MKKVILNMGKMAIIEISWMIYCENQCKLHLPNYVNVQNGCKGSIGKGLNNTDVFSYSPFKIDK